MDDATKATPLYQASPRTSVGPPNLPLSSLLRPSLCSTSRLDYKVLITAERSLKVVSDFEARWGFCYIQCIGSSTRWVPDTWLPQLLFQSTISWPEAGAILRPKFKLGTSMSLTTLKNGEARKH